MSHVVEDAMRAALGMVVAIGTQLVLDVQRQRDQGEAPA